MNTIHNNLKVIMNNNINNPLVHQLTNRFLKGSMSIRGAWWASVSGVAQGRARLKRLSSSSNMST